MLIGVAGLFVATAVAGTLFSRYFRQSETHMGIWSAGLQLALIGMVPAGALLIPAGIATGYSVVLWGEAGALVALSFLLVFPGVGKRAGIAVMEDTVVKALCQFLEFGWLAIVLIQLSGVVASLAPVEPMTILVVLLGTVVIFTFIDGRGIAWACWLTLFAVVLYGVLAFLTVWTRPDAFDAYWGQLSHRGFLSVMAFMFVRELGGYPQYSIRSDAGGSVRQVVLVALGFRLAMLFGLTALAKWFLPSVDGQISVGIEWTVAAIRQSGPTIQYFGLAALTGLFLAAVASLSNRLFKDMLALIRPSADKMIILRSLVTLILVLTAGAGVMWQGTLRAGWTQCLELIYAVILAGSVWALINNGQQASVSRMALALMMMLSWFVYETLVAFEATVILPLPLVATMVVGSVLIVRSKFSHKLS